MHIEFDPDFDERDRVHRIVEDWRSGVEEFELLTSGSTSEPVAMQLPRRLLEWSARNTAEELSLTHERSLIVLPIGRTGGYMQLIRALVQDWDVHLARPSSRPLVNVPSDHSFTLCSMSPMQLRNALENDLRKLLRFRTILVGGAAVDRALEHLAIGLTEGSHIHLIETYGMTETASHIALRPFGSELFQTLPGVELSTGSEGTSIRIPSVGWEVLCTDKLEFEGEGFRIVGRSDRVINSGGLKIHPEQEEERIGKLLMEMGIARGFYLSSRRHPDLGEELILVMEPPPMADSAFILESLKRELPRHHSPKDLVFDTIERTDTGKIKRKKW